MSESRSTSMDLNVVPVTVDAILTVQMSIVKAPEKVAVHTGKCDLWAYIWTSSFVLARLMLKINDICKKKRGYTDGDLQLVELGAGSGLASITAARCGFDVIASDISVEALNLIQTNATNNTCEERVSTVVFDWHKPSEAITSICKLHGKPQARFIGAADVLFLESNCKPVIKAVESLYLADSDVPSIAIIVDPGRFGRDTFEDLARESSLIKVVARMDEDNVCTSFATMKVCTVFLLANKAAETIGLAEDCIDAISTTLRQCAEAEAEKTTIGSNKYGYTLKV